MKHLILSLFIALSFCAQADIPLVPKTIEFGGMTLEISNAARSEIQTSVNRLHASSTFFESYVEKANLYFPIIEAEFAKAGIPDAIKYLCIQESAFKGDAVSRSNAVGYWQFKEATALEQGLRVDHHIDERKNIVSSSRAAAQYHNYHNKSLDNWVFAVIAYNTGLGGVRRYYETKYAGTKTMEINSETHWYFLKFLAHVVAFQDYVGKTDKKAVLKVYEETAGKTLKDFAQQHQIPTQEVADYNHWINDHRKIPDDKTYAVVVPIPYLDLVALASEPTETKAIEEPKKPNKPKQNKAKQNETKLAETKQNEIEQNETKLTEATPREVETQIVHHKKGVVALEINSTNTKNIRYKVNKIKAITAIKGDNISKLALKGGVLKTKFLKYNELNSFEELVPGQTYYLKKKKKRSSTPYHVVQHHETLWQISQKYGVSQKAIIRKNRMSKTESIQPGRVLHLRVLRQEDEPIEYRKIGNAPKTQQELQEIQEEKEQHHQKIMQQKEARKLNTRPLTYQGKEATYTHWVQAGETIQQLSRYYQVSTSEIKEWNSLTSDELVTGSRIGIFESNTSVLQEQKQTPTPVVPSPAAETKRTSQTIDSSGTIHTEIHKPYQVTTPASGDWLHRKDSVETTPEIEPKPIEIKPAPSQENIQFKTIWVEPGTTLYGLSRAHQVSPEEIVTFNQLKSTNLKAGDQIKIPIHSSKTLQKPQEPNTAIPLVPQKEYMVQAGDTFYSVAKKLGQSVEDLKLKNNKTSNTLSVGEVLKY